MASDKEQDNPYAWRAPSVALGEGEIVPIAGGGHSELGIAAFACWIAVAMLGLALIVFIVVEESRTPGAFDDEDSLLSMVLGIGFIGCCGLLIVGVGLGVGGLFQRDRQKATAVMGLCANVLSALLLGGFVLMGTVLE